MNTPVPATSRTVFPFAVAIVTGAFLLFLVQPLIGKYILPWFGGSPGVWTTCLLFFQCLLLAGYAYAHLLITFLQPRQQAVVHSVVIVMALAALPIVPSPQLIPVGDGEPILEILIVLARTIGLPYFALSATGPLMQAWFARVHSGHSPYRLYALSNTGSLVALLAYPLLIETTLTRSSQARWWSLGMVIFAVACGWCVQRLWNASNNPLSAAPIHEIEETDEIKNVPGRTILWLLLSACTTILLMATTNKICQDIAVVPFLWVLPLAIYLITFIIAFDGSRWYCREWYGLALIACWGAVVWALFQGVEINIAGQLLVYSATLFVTCMVCHGELYQLRPAPRRLTAYFLTIATGGALGGFFVAIIAPLGFNSYLEFHVALFSSGLLFTLVCLLKKSRLPLPRLLVPAWIPLLLLTGGLGWGLWSQAQSANRWAVRNSRNFYGVLAVMEYATDDPLNHYLLLRHGRITHGLQYTHANHVLWPTTYYGNSSGVGMALRHTPEKGKRVGVVGLGTGTLAAHGARGDCYRFYDINPEVIRLAGPQGSTFTFLKESPARIEIALGDARLSLEREDPQEFDVLALDAFSSDAVPIHLLTKEAFDIYKRHIRPDGVIAVHVSNRYLDLEPVVLKLAAHVGMQAVIISGSGEEDAGVYSSTWILVTNSPAILNSEEIAAARTDPDPAWPDVPLWTDDYASIVSIIVDNPATTFKQWLKDVFGAKAVKQSEPVEEKPDDPDTQDIVWPPSDSTDLNPN